MPSDYEIKPAALFTGALANEELDPVDAHEDALGPDNHDAGLAASMFIEAGALTRRTRQRVTASPDRVYQRGIASVYGVRGHDRFAGQQTASGDYMDPNALTAAHRHLPWGTRVRVVRGNRSVVVTINDDGPHVAGRVIDLSPAAAARLGIGMGRGQDGVAAVALYVLEVGHGRYNHNARRPGGNLT